MHIVICDDERSTCAELEEAVYQYAEQKKIRIEVEVFFSGELLEDYLKNNKVDLLFLDIELPGKNGVAVGSYIRNILEDEKMFLVYISSKEQYAMQLFQNRPFDFLIKPVTEEKLTCVLNNVCRLSEQKRGAVEFQNQGKWYSVDYTDILYLQSAGRKINLITRTGVQSFYGKLSDLEKKIPESLFLNIHKSYLVNVDYVKEFTYEWVKMVNGDILNISKKNRAEIRRKILERVTDEYRNA